MTVVLHIEADTLAELRRASAVALGLVDQITAAAPIEVKAPDTGVEANGPEREQEPEAKPEPARKQRGRKAEAEPKADPKAEVKTGPKPEPESKRPGLLSRDDVRSVFNRYVHEFGVAATQEDGPKLLARAFGNGLARIVDVPEDNQAKLQEVIAAVHAAISINEFGRHRVGGAQ